MMFGLKQTKSEAFGKELKSLLVGLAVRLTRDHGSWSIHFDERYVVSTYCWRLLGAKSIIVTDEDDGHSFGLSTPVDAETMANDAVTGNCVTDVALNVITGDLSIELGDALALQILTFSSAYETWQLYRDGEFFAAVGNEGLR